MDPPLTTAEALVADIRALLAQAKQKLADSDKKRGE